MEFQDPPRPTDTWTEDHEPKESLALFTFQCTRCRKKPAIITRGRKVFLCPDCATGSLMYDMVGSLMDPSAAPERADDLVPETAERQEHSVESSSPAGEGPTDPWGDSG